MSIRRGRCVTQPRALHAFGRSRSRGAWVRTCQSSREIQAQLYLATVTGGGGAPGTEHSLVLPGTQHVGAQAPFIQYGSTSLRGPESTAEGRQSHIYVFIYTIHTSHAVWVTVPRSEDSIYIYINKGHIDLGQFADTKVIWGKQKSKRASAHVERLRP